MIQQLFLHFFLPWNHLKALFFTEIFMFPSEINRSIKIILMGFCQSWWYILVLEMFTNIVQITNIFFKINYFAFSQVSISKSYNSKISLTHLQSLYFWKTQYSTICFQTSSYLFHWPQSDGESFSLPGWHHLWPRTRKVKHSHKTFSWFEGNWK